MDNKVGAFTMELDLADLVRLGEFTLELNSVGRAICVSLDASHLSQADIKISGSDVVSLDVVRWLFGEMARRPVDGVSDAHDPENNPRFTAEELTAVSHAELEEFADKLVQKNKSPLLLLETHKGNELGKSGDESACDFLVRAFRHYALEQKERRKRFAQDVSASLANSATVATMQQSVVGTIADANRYTTADRASVAMDSLLQRDRNLLLGIGTSIDARAHLEGRSVSAAIDMHFKREQDILRATAGPLQNTRHYLDQSTTSAMLAKAIYANDGLTRVSALGVLQKAAMPGVFALELDKQQRVASDLLTSHEAMFRLPHASEAARLLDSYRTGAVAALVQGNSKISQDQQRIVDAIKTPWLNRVEASRSVAGILELQGIGNALRTLKGFEPALTAALRIDLGDWRDRITFPDSVFLDPIARTDFYVDRGFNTALTDFPEPAFHQCLEDAGLGGETLDIEVFGHILLPIADPAEEAGLQRTNRCHDRLQRFERKLRQFINDAMTAQYGPDWPRKQLDPRLYESWEFKKQQAKSSGILLMLIEFADFTDYETIICKKDHWREVFETRFRKKESVRESLQRLQPIRVTTMHARVVTKEDELFLFAEIMRLSRAIK